MEAAKSLKLTFRYSVPLHAISIGLRARLYCRAKVCPATLTSTLSVVRFCHFQGLIFMVASVTVHANIVDKGDRNNIV